MSTSTLIGKLRIRNDLLTSLENYVETIQTNSRIWHIRTGPKLGHIRKLFTESIRSGKRKSSPVCELGYEADDDKEEPSNKRRKVYYEGKIGEPLARTFAYTTTSSSKKSKNNNRKYIAEPYRSSLTANSKNNNGSNDRRTTSTRRPSQSSSSGDSTPRYTPASPGYIPESPRPFFSPSDTPGSPGYSFSASYSPGTVGSCTPSQSPSCSPSQRPSQTSTASPKFTYSESGADYITYYSSQPGVSRRSREMAMPYSPTQSLSSFSDIPVNPYAYSTICRPASPMSPMRSSTTRSPTSPDFIDLTQDSE